jgi:hypothetical protein
MKKLGFCLLLFTVLVSCQQSISDNDCMKINGYWEIEKVILSNVENKEYKVNETIDFFELKDKKGFRQKLMPQFDGKYKTNGLKEKISISSESGNYYINYSTEYGKWKEEIIEIKDSVLVLKNEDKSKYYYKKFTPFSLK